MPKLKRLMAASTAALAFTATSAVALPVETLFVGGQNNAQDVNREYLINRTGGATTVDIGDSLRFFFSIDKLNSVTANLGGAAAHSEWTGVAQLLVIGKTGTGGILSPFTFTFAPDPAFVGDVCGGVGAPCTNNHAPVAGTVASMFQDPANNLSLDGAGTAEGNANSTHDGAFFWDIGFTGPVVDIDGLGPLPAFVSPGPGQGWIASGLFSDDITAATVGGATLGSIVGLVNAGLDCLAGVQCASVLPVSSNIIISSFNPGSVDFTLSGTVLGVAGLTTPFQVGSNANITFVRVPEPGTLGLLGLALALVGFASRRRAQ